MLLEILGWFAIYFTSILFWFSLFTINEIWILEKRGKLKLNIKEKAKVIFKLFFSRYLIDLSKIDTREGKLNLTLTEIQKIIRR